MNLIGRVFSSRSFRMCYSRELAGDACTCVMWQAVVLTCGEPVQYTSNLADTIFIWQPISALLYVARTELVLVSFLEILLYRIFLVEFSFLISRLLFF